MKVILRVGEDFLGMVNEYTSRENNVEKLDASTINKVVSIFRNGEQFEITEGIVNIVNMDSSNILLDRVCKKSARTIADEIGEYMSKKGGEKLVLSKQG